MFLPEPNGSDFVPPPAGNHAAICFRFIDLGTQLIESKMYGNKEQRTVLISWELPAEHMEDGKPFTVSRRYNWSMHEKSMLRHDLESWRGRAFTNEDFAGPNRFNVKNIIGAPCMINIVHNQKDGSTYGNIAGVTPLPKGMPKPVAINPQVYFSLEPPFFIADVLEGLSDKLKETIRKSPEYSHLTNGKLAAKPSGPVSGMDNFDDPIPF